MTKAHVVTWFEIPATDFDRAVTFYSTILDSEIRRGDMEGVPYGFFPFESENAPGATGAIVHNSSYEPGPSGVVVYLETGADVGTVLDRVKAAGGEVLVSKTEIEPGYIGLIRDTEGNKVGLFNGK